jgi:hypothetical protein
MRDPDLVQRAERAATALERAWIHWRTMHGLGSDPLPPVSSYVGYSLEEPWGQPRVVFGVGAEEAERLAALLDGHDCVGPIHAEVTSRPEWRYGPGNGPGFASSRPFDEQLHIPAQAPQPLADMFPPGSQDSASNDGLSNDGAAIGSASIGIADATAIDSAPIDRAPIDSAPIDSAPIDRAPVGPAAESMPYDGNVKAGAGQAESAEADVAGETDMFALAAAVSIGADDVYLAPLPEPGSPEQLPAFAAPGLVALRRRPEQLGEAEDAAPLAAAPIATRGYDITPTQGPGYRGPRYRGSPPQYRPGSLAEPAPSDDAADQADERDVAPASGQSARSKARQLTRRGRARRQGPGAHEAWDSADERSTSDHAV